MINKLIFFLMLMNVIPVFSQSLISLTENTSHRLSGSFLHSDDSIEVRFISDGVGQFFNGNEPFKKVVVARTNGSLTTTQNQLVDSNLMVFQYKAIKKSGFLFEIGTKHDSGISSPGTIWYINSMIKADSMINLPLLDSNFNSIAIDEVIEMGNYVYVFGGLKIDSFPYNKSYSLKIHKQSAYFQLKSYFCYAAFCDIDRAIYDKLNQKFIVISTARIGNTQAPWGAGIAKLDTNLNLIPNTAQKIDVVYSQHFPQDAYEYSADIEWVNDSLFLTAGTVNNAQQFPSQTPNPNPDYGADIAVSLRSSNTLQEISTTNVYGKVDTAESQGPGEFILEKIDSNLFVAVTNSRYYNPQPEPWNTSLALFGLDTAGNKHWEYYMPYNDYCWAKNAHPTSDGGLWVSIQCSGNLNLQAGTYDYFGKVAYIDSIAHWPRIGTVGEREIKKEAKDFVVYPNPTNDYLKVKQYGLITALNYEVYDQSGRLLRSKKAAEHQVEINIQDLAKGFYILRISNKNGELIKTEKIVKQ
jgi:hypothetical protein